HVAAGRRPRIGRAAGRACRPRAPAPRMPSQGTCAAPFGAADAVQKSAPGDFVEPPPGVLIPPGPANEKPGHGRAFPFGGEGGIRTHVPVLPDHPISNRRRYDRFGTSPAAHRAQPAAALRMSDWTKTLANT